MYFYFRQCLESNSCGGGIKEYSIVVGILVSKDI